MDVVITVSNVPEPPPPALASIVTLPVEPDIVILFPATIEVTIPVKFYPEPLNDDAVIIPLTSRVEVGDVELIPTLSLTISTLIIFSEDKLPVFLGLPIIYVL